LVVFFFQAEDGIRDDLVTGVQTCALPISLTPLDDLIHHSSLSHQRIGRILQSVAIYTKWIAYTKHAFSSPTPPPLSRQEISNLQIGRASCRERVYDRESGHRYNTEKHKTQ